MGHRTVSLLAILLAAPVIAQQPANDPNDDAAQAEERGFDYWLGRGVEPDAAAAASWLEQAAAADRPHAASLLANLYQSGQGVPRDVARALELARRPAELGVAPAQSLLGFQLVLPSDIPSGRDPAAGSVWLRAAAEQEDPAALFLLGQMHRYGDFVAADEELSLRLTMRAAELGHPIASGEAAAYLLRGEPPAADLLRGLFFLRASASSNYPPAAYHLGKLHLTGRYVERDPGVAMQWLTHASERGYRLATLWLAEVHAKGLAAEADAARAAELRGQVSAALTVFERNEFAWELAVSTDDKLRNGVLAVEIMEAVELSAPAHLDTLAAAYAEAGRFDDAVRAQERAVAALPDATAAATRASFGERIELYRAEQPYREAP